MEAPAEAPSGFLLFSARPDFVTFGDEQTLVRPPPPGGAPSPPAAVCLPGRCWSPLVMIRRWSGLLRRVGPDPHRRPCAFPVGVRRHLLQLAGSGDACLLPIAAPGFLGSDAKPNRYRLLMAYPRRLLTDGEEVVREFRPHWRLLVIPVFWALLGIAIVIVTWKYTPDNEVFDWVVTGVVLIGSLKLVFYPFVAWWFTSYVLTNERLIRRSGILSRAGLEMPLENINDVRFTQSVFERVLRSGDVLVESAGERGQSRFSDIPEPEDFHSLIYKVREVRARDLADGRGAEGADGVSKLERLGRLLKEGLITQEEYDSKKQGFLDEI